MRARLLTLRFSATFRAFDERPLVELQRGHRILGFREHFFEAEGMPHLLCVALLKEPPPPLEKERREGEREAEAGKNGRHAEGKSP